MTLSDKYGLTTAVARKRAGLPPLQSLPFAGTSSSPSSSKDATKQPVEMVPAESFSIDEIETLPEDLFEKEVSLCQVTTIKQRNLQLDHCPESVKNLFPKHKHLMIKRSQRCRKCEHNLSKPEYNPSSIKFKIQLAAYYHVPEISIFKTEPMRAGTRCHYIMKIVNPTQHATKIEFLTPEAYEAVAETKRAEEEQNKANNQAEKKTVSILRNPSLIKAADHHKIGTNAGSLVPAGSVFLPPRDDAAEFDDASPDLKGVVDDKNVVAWRKGNKVGIFFTAEVGKQVSKGEEVVTSFAMKFIYTNTISALEQREVQTADIYVPVFVVLGNESE